jgi:DNA modification methylase
MRTLTQAIELGIPLETVRTTGDKLVVVVREDLDTNDPKRKALALADNRTSELSEWDSAVVSELFSELPQDLQGVSGFDESSINSLLNADGHGSVIEDEVPEPPVDPITKPGDLWILGEHRLLCGDSKKDQDVSRLLDGKRPFLMVTDPPYGVNYDPEWREQYDQFERHSRGKVANDDICDWTPTYKLFGGDVAYVWHAGVFAGDLAVHLHNASFQIRTQVIWAKQHFVFGRGSYHWQHEPCWYAVRKGKQSKWCGDRTQSTIWNIANKKKQDDENTQHGTQKPVECMARPIRNHGGPDDDVYDPFLGSGTTLIAAEQLKRRCFGLEISQAYCDVIVQRWEKLTGRKAERHS